MIRTMLFVPGGDQRKLHKARGCQADIVILDLEDAVPGPQKQAARRLIALELASGDSRRDSFAVRVNAINSPEFASDFELLASIPAPRWVFVPKIGSASDVREVRARLDALSTPDAPISIAAILETPVGVLDAGPIARAVGPAGALLFGTADYCASLGIRESPDRSELTHARSHVALAAAAHGCLAFDAPYYFDIADLDALARDARLGRQLGYNAKAAIHPAHLAVIEATYSPSEADTAWARDVIRASEQAEGGAVRLGRSMIDAPIVDQARAVLAQANGRRDGGAP